MTYGERFDELVAEAHELAERWGEPGSYDKAGRLIAGLVWLIRESGLGDIALARVHAAARQGNEDDPPDRSDLSDTKAMLQGMAKFIEDFAPAVFQEPMVKTMASVPLLRSVGEETIHLMDIPLLSRPYRRFRDSLEGRICLMAEYYAGLNGTRWLAELQKIWPTLGSESGGKKWRREIDPHELAVARSAGKKRGRQEPLTDEETELEKFLRTDDPTRGKVMNEAFRKVRKPKGG